VLPPPPPPPLLLLLLLGVMVRGTLLASSAGKDSPGPAGYHVFGYTRAGRSSKERWTPHSISFPVRVQPQA
jgi:hypothetical protein